MLIPKCSALIERCGRLSDGWLPSLCTPEEAAAGRVVIEKAAAEAGRSISGEHFGMSIGYAREPLDPATARTMAARRPRAVELTPVGLPALRQLLERFIAVGFSKFVVRPVVPPRTWRVELEALAGAAGVVARRAADPGVGGGRPPDLSRRLLVAPISRRARAWESA